MSEEQLGYLALGGCLTSIGILLFILVCQGVGWLTARLRRSRRRRVPFGRVIDVTTYQDVSLNRRAYYDLDTRRYTYKPLTRG